MTSRPLTCCFFSSLQFGAFKIGDEEFLIQPEDSGDTTTAQKPHRVFRRQALRPNTYPRDEEEEGEESAPAADEPVVGYCGTTSGSSGYLFY